MEKARIHRLLQLVTLLQSGKMSTQELMHQLGVSRRTLFRDLSTLSAAGIPYYHEPRKGFGVARNFFLPPVSLTVTETLALLLLGKELKARRRQPMISQAIQAIQKLSATVPAPMRNACAELVDAVSINPGPMGARDSESLHYHTLARCIQARQACRLFYRRPMEDKPSETVLRPLALHYASRAWYVLGSSSDHPQDIRLYKLVRIVQLDALKQWFERPEGDIVSQKLGKAWSLIPEGQTHRIELEFTAKVATNVAEVHWHESQQVTPLPDGRCRVRFEVDGLNEIAWWICGYADQVTVLAPEALRHKVRDMLTSAARHHQRAPEAPRLSVAAPLAPSEVPDADVVPS